MTKEALYKWCDGHFEELVALLKELAAIPAPSHQEDRRAAFIRDWLVDLGAENVTIDEAKNVLLPLGCEGRDDIRVYAAHTDVVFPDLTPLPVREEGGRLFAPGVGDDTANVCALMMTVKLLLTEGVRPKEPVLIVFNSCEEGLGNLKGVRQLFETYKGRIREFVSFDGNYTALVNRAVGSIRWEVRAATRGGHSYGAFGNPNAIAHLAALVGRLYAQPVPQREGRKTTYNVGTIEGGTSVNTIAQSAKMTYEVRSDDAECLAVMQKQFETLLREADGEDARFEATVLGVRPCGGDVPEEAEERLLARCHEAVRTVTGIEPYRRSSSTDANLPLSLGIPATTFGLYIGERTHTREEFLETESLRSGLRICAALLTGSFDKEE